MYITVPFLSMSVTSIVTFFEESLVRFDGRFVRFNGLIGQRSPKRRDVCTSEATYVWVLARSSVVRRLRLWLGPDGGAVGCWRSFSYCVVPPVSRDGCAVQGSSLV